MGILEGKIEPGNHENGDFQRVFSIWPNIAANRQTLAALPGSNARGAEKFRCATAFPTIGTPFAFP